MKSYILNYSRVFKTEKIIKCVLVSGKQMSSTPVSLKPYIYNLPYKSTNTQKQLAYMHQQETLVRIYKLKITK